MGPCWYKDYFISKQMGEKRKLISVSRISASKCKKMREIENHYLTNTTIIT